MSYSVLCQLTSVPQSIYQAMHPMNTPSSLTTHLGPTTERERIQVLDWIRAIALLGIFLVNIEFFNRQLGERGIPLDATGLDRWIGWCIHLLVEGKAWILFAFLFGVGMSMTTMRSVVGQPPSLYPFLRRIGGLALFGAFHCILLWRGDILFLYAISAVGLLIVLHCPTRYALLAIIAVGALGMLTGVDPKASYALCLLMLGLAGLYVQSQRRFPFMGMQWDTASFLLGMAGIVVCAITIAMGVMRGWSANSSLVLFRAVCFLSASAVAAWFRHDRESRILWAALGLYCLPSILGAATGLVQFSKALTVEPTAGVTAAAVATSTVQTDSEPSEETRLVTRGSYWENVVWRTKFFFKNAVSEASLVTTTVAIFLLGVWFVRIRAIEKALSQPQRMRWTAVLGLTMGFTLTTVGKYLEGMDIVQPTAGVAAIASSLIALGSLPASLGIIATCVLIFRHPSVVARIQFLLPVGRMALTNYLLQSFVGALLFYGIGFGLWGLGRTGQAGIVILVFGAQVVWSNLWLSRFRMGPCEWILRAITYWQLPAMRKSGDAL